MRSFPRSSRPLLALPFLALAACGPHYHLNEYDFSNHSVALVYLAPARPVLRTGAYDAADATNAATAVLRAGSGVAKEIEGRRARTRLDSALMHVNVEALLTRSARSIARVATWARVRSRSVAMPTSCSRWTCTASGSTRATRARRTSS